MAGGRVFCIGNGKSRTDYNLEKLRGHGKIYGCNAIYRDFLPDVICGVDHGIMHEIYHAGIAEKIPTYFRDWTRVPEAHFEMMFWAGLNTMDREKIKENYDNHVENEKGDRKEFVLHGMNMAGQINIIRRYENKPEAWRQFKKEIDHANIYVSWVHDGDKAVSLKDFYEECGERKDRGWACGATSGKVALVKEQPEEIYLIGHDMVSNDNQVNNVYAGTKHYVAKENTPTPHTNWEQQWCNLIKEYPKVKFFKVNPNADRGPDKVSKTLPLWQRFVQSGQVSYIDYPTLDKRLGL